MRDDRRAAGLVKSVDVMTEPRTVAIDSDQTSLLNPMGIVGSSWAGTKCIVVEVGGLHCSAIF
ncbi:MAG TPA: hypothetical protein VJ482_00325 [Acidimicrobiia bacterium]|nr:hypothetical protein [Acidimicrobiia bacterium]